MLLDNVIEFIKFDFLYAHVHDYLLILILSNKLA